GDGHVREVSRAGEEARPQTEAAGYPAGQAEAPPQVERPVDRHFDRHIEETKPSTPVATRFAPHVEASPPAAAPVPGAPAGAGQIPPATPLSSAALSSEEPVARSQPLRPPLGGGGGPIMPPMGSRGIPIPVRPAPPAPKPGQ